MIPLLSESHFISATFGLLVISGFSSFCKSIHLLNYNANKPCSHLIWKSSNGPVEASRSTINNHVSLLTYMYRPTYVCRLGLDIICIMPSLSSFSLHMHNWVLQIFYGLSLYWPFLNSVYWIIYHFLCCWHVIRKAIWYLCRIFEFSKYYLIFICFVFFNLQNWDSQQGRDSCLKIYKYYVIFLKVENSAHIK